MNFDGLRKTYSVSKYRHLVKPVLFCAPDGYILDTHGPYFANAANNDASILNSELRLDEHLGHWLNRGDIVILDRGYSDSGAILEARGVVVKMPHSIKMVKTNSQLYKQMSQGLSQKLVG